MSTIVRGRIALPMDALADLCRRYHVRELALFGSVLRDDFRDDSDIDVLVEFEPDARTSFFTLSALTRELETLFGRPVDVVPKPGLNPIIRDEVLSMSEVVYAR